MKSLRCVTLSLALLCASALQSTVYAETGVSSGEIVIGMSAPLRGAMGPVGADMRDAISASFDRVNAGGGIYGRKLMLESFDDDAEPARTVANTKILLNDHQAFALIAYYGDASLAAAMPLINDAKIPLVGAVSGAAALRHPVNPYLFHVRAGYDDEIAAMVAQFMSLRLTRIAVIYQNDALGKANANSFAAALKKYKLVPAAVASVEPPASYTDSVNVTAAVQAFSAAQPQAVLLLVPYKPAAELVRQMKKIGLFPQYLALSTVGSDQLAQVLGENGRGIGISQVMPYPWDSTVPVVRDYQRLFGAGDRNAIYSYSSMEGYMTARVLIEALKKAGKDLTREKLIAALENLDIDVGGYHVNYSQANHDGSRFVELTVTGPGGRMLR
jgi:branched-chain amino acid transport system substrate-binding protein